MTIERIEEPGEATPEQLFFYLWAIRPLMALTVCGLAFMVLEQPFWWAAFVLPFLVWYWRDYPGGGSRERL